MILVKLGGSILTNKGQGGRPLLRRAQTSRLLGEVKRGARRRPLVIVLGAGSFGHGLAVRLRIGQARLGGRRLVSAVSRVQASVRRLRHHVLLECERLGLAAADLPAGSLAYGRGRDTYLDASIVAAYARSGLVPVTGGDVILDARMGARVLSGDEILAGLAAPLKASRVVFATDVDGVLEDGAVVPRLSQQAARKIPTGRNPLDATGGMGGKLRAASQIAKAGVPVWIVNGLRPGRLGAAVAGRSVVGTLVEP